MDPQESTAKEEGKTYMGTWRKHLARSLVAPGKVLALAVLLVPSLVPHETVMTSRRQVRKTQKGMWAAGRKLIRPVVFIKFRGIVFRVAVLNSNPT